VDSATLPDTELVRCDAIVRMPRASPMDSVLASGTHGALMVC